MSHPNNNDENATNTPHNEIIDDSINTFLQNITNSIYNNSFLDTDDSNTIYNESFMTDIPLPTGSHLAPPPPNIESPPPPPPLRTTSIASAVGFIPLNHPNIGGSVGNRFLLRPTRIRPTRIRFHNNFPDGTYGNNILNSVIQRSFNEDLSAFKNVISDEGKQLLEPVRFSSLDTEETKCTIMQDTFKDDTTVIELPCKHVFCEEAIMHWLENESASCPVCRTKLPSKEMRIEKDRNISESVESDNNGITMTDSVVQVTRVDTLTGGEIANEENGQRVRSSSAPTPLSENISLYYHSIINNITRIRQLNEEEDTQQAIWNSITNSSP